VCEPRIAAPQERAQAVGRAPVAAQQAVLDDVRGEPQAVDLPAGRAEQLAVPQQVPAARARGQLVADDLVVGVEPEGQAPCVEAQGSGSW
jgi:hypothetical protein